MNPLEIMNTITEAINRGDIEAMLKFFAPEAVLIVQALGDKAAQQARGKAAIYDAYKGFFLMKPHLVRNKQKIVEAGDTTLHFSSWTLTATMPDGREMERTGTSADVLHKKDGNWFVMVYNPYGTDALG